MGARGSTGALGATGATRETLAESTLGIHIPSATTDNPRVAPTTPELRIAISLIAVLASIHIIPIYPT